MLQCYVVVEIYKETVFEPLPYDAFGFSSAVEFIKQKMPDVARIATYLLTIYADSIK